MSKDNGGAAFPVADLGVHGASGMSLLDWMAGQALTGLGTWSPCDKDFREETAGLGHQDPEWHAAANRARARYAYDQAYAMLVEKRRRESAQ